MKTLYLLYFFPLYTCLSEIIQQKKKKYLKENNAHTIYMQCSAPIAQEKE